MRLLLLLLQARGGVGEGTRWEGRDVSVHHEFCADGKF